MIELWDILDKNGNVTGRVHERGKPMNKGEYLISQRSPNKMFPNIWECTGGNVIAGDDSLTTALKEAKEELGIILEPQNGRMIQHHLRCCNEECHGLVDVWLFRQNVNIATIILAPDETCNAKWVSRDEINRMIDEGTFTTWELCTYIDESFEEL